MSFLRVIMQINMLKALKIPQQIKSFHYVQKWFPKRSHETLCCFSSIYKPPPRQTEISLENPDFSHQFTINIVSRSPDSSQENVVSCYQYTLPPNHHFITWLLQTFSGLFQPRWVRGIGLKRSVLGIRGCGNCRAVMG